MLDQAGYRNRKALKVARKGLQAAEYLLREQGGKPASNQRLRFYGEVSKALWKYLGDKLNIPQSQFSVEGALADLVVVDAGDRWRVTPDSLASRGKNTPLLGRDLPGRVLLTVAQGRLAYRDADA